MDLKKLLSQMTIREKVGQLEQYNAILFWDTDADITGPKTELGLKDSDLEKVGSVLNFCNVDEMIAIQDKHLAADRNKIPMMFMMDVIHGYRTIYPIPLALSCSFDTKLATECAELAAKEAAADGVHATFAPMVDYARDARWGRIMEAYGEEPMINGIMGAAQIKGYNGGDISKHDRIATCVKHFAGYGAAEAGRDYNTTDLSEHILREFYLPAYKACIDAGVDMLMPSYNSLNGISSVANPWLMKKILKEEWGYEGVIISDFNAIGELLGHGIAGDLKQAAKMAFDCGCDIEMCSSAYFHHLEELINEGVFTEEQLDKAVMKVLEMKERLGLFEDPYHGASPEKAKKVLLSPENRAIVRKAASESAVLLKNDNILPFSHDTKKIAIIGPFADENKIIGFWACHGVNEESVTVAEGIRNALPDAEITVVKGCGDQWFDTDRSEFDKAILAAKNADAVILCLGEPQNYSGEGNCRTNLELPDVQNELAEAVALANPNTAAVIFNGRPIVLTRLSKCVPAILDMWFPGTEGGNAAADLLFGKVNPAGKLTSTFPRATGQCPIYYNHPSTARPRPIEKENEKCSYISSYLDCGNLPLYSFGHGLSYSNFVYEDMQIDKSELTAGDKLTVSVTVYNDSAVAGKETVQLYMRDLVASVVRPIQQLIAFEKTEFKPFERKTITFTVDEPMLRFWNFENKFVSEPGEFDLSTGYADHLQHTKRFVLK